MSDELVFYTNPMSRGRIARWMLEEVGHPYRTEIMNFGGNIKEAPYLAINPMGKVPAIVHRDTVVTEGGAICAYLADAFPERGLAPPIGDPQRGTYYRWLFFAAGPLEAAATNQALGFKAPPDKKGMMGYGSLADVTDALETAIAAGPYICGEQFTAADVYVGANIGWLIERGVFEKRPAFAAYGERIKSRPAAARATELDDSVMPKKSS